MEIAGLKKLRSGGGQVRTTATEGSKTQERKKALASYNIHQRKFGENGVAK